VYDLRQVRRLWRNERSNFDEGRPGALPRAWRRQHPLITVTFIPFLIALLVLSFTDDTGSGAVGQVAVGVMVVCGAAMGPLTVTNMLFNRPKFVAPPHLRSEPGWLCDLVDG
jgi:hypothetical protein